MPQDKDMVGRRFERMSQDKDMVGRRFEGMSQDKEISSLVLQKRI